MTTTMVMATTLGEGDTVGKAGGRWERRRDLMGLFFSFVRESRCVCVSVARVFHVESNGRNASRLDGSVVRFGVDGRGVDTVCS